jgi:hypothetical protein
MQPKNRPSGNSGGLFIRHIPIKKVGPAARENFMPMCIMALVPLAVFFNFITKFYEVRAPRHKKEPLSWMGGGGGMRPEVAFIKETTNQQTTGSALKI